MATYAIGDLQGCAREFEALLRQVGFSKKDELWLLGDLVNRGPDSLAVLRRVRDMGDRCEVILGNHDLHLLAIVFGGHKPSSSDTFDELLDAPDLDELAHWLRAQKMVHRDAERKFTMVHAGIPPQWSLGQAQALAHEVESVIGGDGPADGIGYVEFFESMYGNKPAHWSSDLTGIDRLKSITNYLTRMRLLDDKGSLDFSHKGALRDAPPELTPWYDLAAPLLGDETLLFGHWAALDGVTGHDNVRALDTGCVWGRKLTALCLESGVVTQQDAL
jgi:bis(5'-nucleosyl)-tetraphosphatase (symmetrical)